MNSKRLFEIADRCIEMGFFPGLVGRRYVLRLEVQGTGWTSLHKKHVGFEMLCPCRVWIVSGRVRYMLGDSFALPDVIDGSSRPAWTG